MSRNPLDTIVVVVVDESHLLFIQEPVELIILVLLQCRLNISTGGCLQIKRVPYSMVSGGVAKIPV